MNQLKTELFPTILTEIRFLYSSSFYTDYFIMMTLLTSEISIFHFWYDFTTSDHYSSELNQSIDISRY